MATTLHTATKNTTAVFLNRLISMVCSVVFLGLFSRYVGVNQFGQSNPLGVSSWSAAAGSNVESPQPPMVWHQSSRG